MSSARCRQRCFLLWCAGGWRGGSRPRKESVQVCCVFNGAARPTARLRTDAFWRAACLREQSPRAKSGRHALEGAAVAWRGQARAAPHTPSTANAAARRLHGSVSVALHVLLRCALHRHTVLSPWKSGSERWNSGGRRHGSTTAPKGAAGATAVRQRQSTVLKTSWA